MDNEEIGNLAHIFRSIAGNEPHPMFGEPFMSAFKATYTSGSEEEITAAAYICSLFLSAISEGFPTERLHTFVKYVKERCECFTFDCKMYDAILDKMENDSLRHVALIDSNAHTVFRECSRNDIKEAFDFYTNR